MLSDFEGAVFETFEGVDSVFGFVVVSVPVGEVVVAGFLGSLLEFPVVLP